METGDVSEVEKVFLVVWLTWGRKGRVGSRITPRLRLVVEGVMVEPSMLREKLVEWCG